MNENNHNYTCISRIITRVLTFWSLHIPRHGTLDNTQLETLKSRAIANDAPSMRVGKSVNDQPQLDITNCEHYCRIFSCIEFILIVQNTTYPA